MTKAVTVILAVLISLYLAAFFFIFAVLTVMDQDKGIKMTDDKINRNHVLESSIDFLLRQVTNQRIHIANLLAKTEDKESYYYLQEVFDDIETFLEDTLEDSKQ